MMNLKKRLVRLKEKSGMKISVIDPNDVKLLEQFNEMNSKDPNYDVIEHISIYRKVNPHLSYEAFLEEALM